MTEISHSEKPPFKCGKCGSRGLYRDDDRLNNASFIVCPICGNRWPGGPAPVKVEMKQEEVMANKKGTCPNCKRENVSLVPGLKAPLCWACQKYAAGTTGDVRIEKLAEAAEKYKGIKQEKNMERKPNPAPAPADPSAIDKTEPPTKQVITETAFPHADSFVVRFMPEDKDLFDYFVAKCRNERRLPGQQILYLLDCNRQADLEAGTSSDRI